MIQNEMNIYTDASFNKSHNIGVMGFIIFTSKTTHEKSDFKSSIIKTSTIHEVNNIRVELQGHLSALEYCFELSKELHGRGYLEINVYTDCQNIYSLLSRRERLESANYISKGSGKRLINADLYQTIYTFYDYLKPNIKLVKGHSPTIEKNLILSNFSFIDRLVRRKLREVVK